MPVGESEAIQRVVPQDAATAPKNAPSQTAFTNTSTLAVQIFTSGTSSGAFITVKPHGTCRLIFGIASVRAAAATDPAFWDQQTEDMWVPPGVTHFRVIQDT